MKYKLLFFLFLLFVAIIVVVVILTTNVSSNHMNRKNVTNKSDKLIVFLTHKLNDKIKDKIKFLKTKTRSDVNFVVFVPYYSSHLKSELENMNVDFIIGHKVPIWNHFDYDAHSESWWYFWEYPQANRYIFVEYDIKVQNVEWNKFYDWIDQTNDELLSNDIDFAEKDYENNTWLWPIMKTYMKNTMKINPSDYKTYDELKEKTSICTAKFYFAVVKQSLIDKVHKHLKEYNGKSMNYFSYNKRIDRWKWSLSNKPQIPHFEILFCTLSDSCKEIPKYISHIANETDKFDK